MPRLWCCALKQMLNSSLSGASRAAHTRPGRAGTRLTAGNSDRVAVPVSPAGQRSGAIGPAQPSPAALPARGCQPRPRPPGAPRASTDPATPRGERTLLARQPGRAGRQPRSLAGGTGPAAPRSTGRGCCRTAPPGPPAPGAVPAPTCSESRRSAARARGAAVREVGGRQGGREGYRRHPPAFPFQAGGRRWGRAAQLRPTGRTPGRAEPSRVRAVARRRGQRGTGWAQRAAPAAPAPQQAAAACASGPASASDRCQSISPVTAARTLPGPEAP